MAKPDVYVMGRLQNGRFYTFMSGLRIFCNWVALFAIILPLTSLIVQYSVLSSSVAYASGVTVLPLSSPILDRIADCESGNGKAGSATHFNKLGQVIFKANKNGSVDIGKYQINSAWDAQAHKLHLDLTKEEDNREMAEWLYLNRGTGDWSASQACWKK